MLSKKENNLLVNITQHQKRDSPCMKYCTFIMLDTTMHVIIGISTSGGEKMSGIYKLLIKDITGRPF
jgi:hypothetical protein